MEEALRYPDKPPHASDGKAFEALCVALHAYFLRELIEVFPDRHRQYTIGESVQGVEFKELQRSASRLHIELAERVTMRHAWAKSGIMRADNTIRYVCGNHEDIFAFLKADLVDWYELTAPDEVWYGPGCGLKRHEHPLAMIRSAVLQKIDALAQGLYLYRFQRYEDGWRMHVRNRAWLVENLTARLPQQLMEENRTWLRAQ